jgi:predicted nucleotide-binding protein (sugar kinase/HSP70/actin superfamily)
VILDEHGRGFEKAEVYEGELSFIEVSLKLPINIYFAFMFGGLLRKIGCKLRPYEREKGRTDAMIDKCVDILSEAFSGRRSKKAAVIEAVSLLETIETSPHSRPKAAIFGDLYVRDNDFMNQDLVRFIENNGGEVITTPYTYYLKMIAGTYLRKWLIEGSYWNVFSYEALLMTLKRLEKTYYRYFNRILKEPEPDFNDSAKKILGGYNLRIEHTGESMDNILKIHYLLKEYPDISLFVQTSPAFCCPSVVTEAMAREIEQKTGVPVVSITYDGTGGFKNEAVIPYLQFSGDQAPASEGLQTRKQSA